jgi:adenylate cyclase
MKKTFDLKHLALFVGISFLFLILIFSGSFGHIKAALSDGLHGGEQPLDNIIIVKIDDQSINKLGRWPWDRDIFAQILDKVKDAKVIGIDVSFFEKSDNDQLLENKIAELDNLVLAAEFNDNQLFKPIFNTDYGYVNLYTDPDGITRGITKGLTLESLPFSFKIYQKYIAKEDDYLEQTHLINFVTEPGMFNSISVIKVLNNNENDFNNKIVLIGATAPDLHDNYFVPTSNGVAMNGVEIHANVLQNIILNNFLTKQSKGSVFVMLLLIGFLGMFFISKLKVHHSLLIIVLAIILYALTLIFVFENFEYVLDIFFPMIGLIVYTFAGTGLNYINEKKLNAHLTNAFGKYISKDLLKNIIDRKHELKLGGAKRTITIFFSDIRGFTSISEKLKPEELVHLLNEYLTEMTKLILQYKGTVDKFIGDAVMAFWNAPLEEEKHAELACSASIEQIKKLKELQTKWKKENLPVMEIGVGVHTGEAIIGNMGSEDRFDYTAMGDTINLGSRLEGLTKQYGVSIITSEDTYKLVKRKFKFRKLDAVKVKGKNIPVVIYQLCIDYDKKFVESYQEALELYFDRKFQKALEKFEKLLETKKDDVSCKLFIDRCKKYLKVPPDQNWDGAFVMKSK